MWKAINKIVTPLIQQQGHLLTPETILHQQLRTTYILKRHARVYQHKRGSAPKRLRNKHYMYDLVEDTSIAKQPDIDVILTAYVEGLGEAGQRLAVKRNQAYNKLLLPGLAVYATPENCEEYKNIEVKEVLRSSPTAERTVNCLKTLRLSVVMNKDMPWVLKPWHLKASFRKSGFRVPEHAITLPEKPIAGPNMDLEGKSFYVTVTINNLEKVNVLCRIRHWSTLIADRLPYVPEFWKETTESIFPEQDSVLASIRNAAEEIKSRNLD